MVRGFIGACDNGRQACMHVRKQSMDGTTDLAAPSRTVTGMVGYPEALTDPSYSGQVTPLPRLGRQLSPLPPLLGLHHATSTRQRSLTQLNAPPPPPPPDPPDDRFWC